MTLSRFVALETRIARCELLLVELERLVLKLREEVQLLNQKRPVGRPRNG